MTALSIPVVIMASISFYVGLYHLFVYCRRPSSHRQDLTFALTCLSVGVYDVLCAGLYNVTSAEAGVWWQRRQLVTLALLDIAFLWFVVDYTSQQSKKLVYVFSVAFLAFAVLGMVDRSGLCWTDQSFVRTVQLPFGLAVTYYEMAFGPAMDLEAYLLIISYFYMLWVTVRYYQSEDRRRGAPLTLAVVLFLAGVATDTAVATGLYEFIYMIEYSYIGMVLLMASSLSNELVEAAVIKEALKESERKHRELLEMIPQKIFYKDVNSVYISCNDNYAHDFNMSPDQITGKTDYDLYPVELSDKYRADDKGIIASGSIETFEEEYVLPDGRNYIVQTVKAPIRDEKGAVGGLLGIFMDVTRARQLELQLKQTQKMEAIGTLAGGIAHDFNNILGGIIGYTELALDECVRGSTQQTYLQSVLKSASRAKNLVKQILTFSRKSQDERKPIQLAVIIHEVAKLIRSTIPTTIEIRQHIDNAAGMVNADPTQMHQIAMNLCTNAAHAMQARGGVLEIVLAPVEITPESMQQYHDVAPGPFVELKISDTGTGIDSRIIHRIFDPFFTTKEKEQGTGMGLAVVHGIVKDHGGDINVESHLGKGTTFTILLPRVLAAPGEEDDAPSAIPTGSERILLVDDEKTLKDIGKQMLTSLGYTVTAFNSSLDALEAFRRLPDMFDVVITDQTMPHMTGYDLARRIMEIKPAASVILCTGYSDSITPERVAAVGIKALIYKPITKTELAQKIRLVLDRK